MPRKKKQTVDLFDGLNPSQQEVVKHTQGPLVTCATAGSGKTLSITHMIGHLIQNGTEPSKIMATTFTVKAAAEMSERLKRLGFNTDKKHGVRIGTIHAICLQCLFKDSPWKDYEVEDDNQMSVALKVLLGYRGMNWNGYDLTLVEGFISNCKNNLVEPEDSVEFDLAKGDKRYAEAYFMFEEERNRRGLITFDDMLMLSVKHLRADEDARNYWANKYEYVIVDEFQDTNLAQYEFVKILAEGAKAFIAVGDDDQAIFCWRGALPQTIIDFEKVHKAKVIHLDTNYRSKSEIVKLGNRVVKNNKNRIEKEAKPYRTSNGSDVITFKDLPDMDEEAKWTAGMIKEKIASKDFTWGDHTILYRTNAQSRAFEEVFIKENIPHVVIGGIDFYQRKEVKEILAYMRLTVNWNDDRSAQLAINRPFRFIGVRSIDKIKEVAEVSGKSFMDVVENCGRYELFLQSRQISSLCRFTDLIKSFKQDVENGLSVPDLISKALRETGYEKWLLESEGSNSSENDRTSNLRELVRSSARFKSLKHMFNHIDNIAREKMKRKGKQGEKLFRPDLVQLMSIHKSKGLEFPVVFLAGASEGILPHARSENIEEERRLFYVACTRAMDRLFITAPRTVRIGSNEVALPVSKFVEEGGLLKKNGDG